jgi:hypothetical protein
MKKIRALEAENKNLFQEMEELKADRVKGYSSGE